MDQPSLMSIAIQIHIFYTDILPEIIANLNYIPVPFDLFVSTDTEQKAKYIQDALAGKVNNIKHIEVGIFINRGRDILPFIQQLRPVIGQYDYILHLHTKKSLTMPMSWSAEWRHYLYRNLLGSKENVLHILEIFMKEKMLGLIFPPDYPTIPTGNLCHDILHFDTLCTLSIYNIFQARHFQYSSIQECLGVVLMRRAWRNCNPS